MQKVSTIVIVKKSDGSRKIISAKQVLRMRSVSQGHSNQIRGSHRAFDMQLVAIPVTELRIANSSSSEHILTDMQADMQQIKAIRRQHQQEF